MQELLRFWRGELPLGRAFWGWGILGGTIVALFITGLALALLIAGAPAWLAVAVFVTDIPWNLGLALGVWRSTERPQVNPERAKLARGAILVWAVFLSLV